MRVLTKSQWHEDLRFLAKELPRRHANAFHHTSLDLFETHVTELDGKLDRLNSDEIYVGMNRLANMIGDGHTYLLSPTDDAPLSIKVDRFGDDYRVVAVDSGSEGALGGRVIKIGDTPIMRARELLISLTPADETEALRESRLMVLLTRGCVLHGAGIIQDRNEARYTLADDGKEFIVVAHQIVVVDGKEPGWIYAFKSSPLFRQRPHETFWYTYLPDSNAIYVSFRGYKDLSRHSKGLLRLIRQNDPEKLVIDLRDNGGGDYEKGLKHIVHPIRDLSRINQRGHLFILIGPKTFSAAMSNTAHFRYQTNAVLVGQQIGEKPNSYQESRVMKLPNSQWKVQYSTKFYKFVENGENLIRPDVEVLPTWDDYKAGRDPVLERALRY